MTAGSSAEEVLRRLRDLHHGPAALAGALAPPPGAEGANAVLARSVAAEVLGEISGPDAIRALAGALDDGRRAVRTAAALALAREGEGGETILPALGEALVDERWEVAEEAAAALSRAGGDAALRLLADTAGGGTGRAARQRAIRALGRWPGAGAAHVLAGLPGDPDPQIRVSVLWALAGRPEAAAREALEALARDPVREIRRRARDLLLKARGRG